MTWEEFRQELYALLKFSFPFKRIKISGDTSNIGLDIESGFGQTRAKFGSDKPVYIVSSGPWIGFNLYCNSYWYFGKGSSGSYGAIIGVSASTGQIRIYVTDSGNEDVQANPFAAMTINASGHVGIGISTSTPSARLHVACAAGGESLRLTDATYSTIKIVHSSASKTEFREGDDNCILSFYAGKVGISTATPTSVLQVVGLPVYANNAAAVTGGLTAGAFYRTGGDPDQVCVVH